MREIATGAIIGGNYQLVRPLGHGGGHVWAARHTLLDREFAVKLVVTSEEAMQRGETTMAARRRFEREACIAADLSHRSRHLAQIIDQGNDGKVGYMVMELLQGEGLDQHIGKGRTLGGGEVSAIVTQTAQALSVAHKMGVIHRDLQPSNVFLTEDQVGDVFVKLLDFGVARPSQREPTGARKAAARRTKLTLRGATLGDRTYASPEQAMGESVDARADVWSLAVVAYLALAGESPFAAGTLDEMIGRICTFDATPLRSVLPGASEVLEKVFERAFARIPNARFQTAAGFAGALAAALPPAVKRLQRALPPPVATRARVVLQPGPGLAPRIAPPPARSRLSSLSLGIRVPLASRRGPIAAVVCVVALVLVGFVALPKLTESRRALAGTPVSASATATATASATLAIPPPPPPETSSPPPEQHAQHVGGHGARNHKHHDPSTVF